MELTRECNQKCIFCSNNASLDGECLGIEEIKRLIDDLLKLDVEDLRFYGGEPFLSPEIFEVMGYIHAHGIEMSVYTNGTILDEDIISNLKKYNIKRLLISLDGSSPNIHDEIRGVKGSFDRTIINLKKLIENDINVAVSCTVCSINKEDIENLYRLAYSMGIRDIKVNFVSKIGRARERWHDLSLTEDEMRECSRMINEIHSQFFGSSPTRKHCQAGVDEIYIAANGEVFPCVLLHENEYRAGNIRDNNIIDIIKRPDGIFGNVREIFQKKQYCSKCEKRDICGGGCRARAIAEHNHDLCAPDVISCISYKKT